MRRLLLSFALGAALLLPTITPALADPITCPPGQHSEKVGTAWMCVNNGDSGNPNTEETKNPNDKILSDYAVSLIEGTLAAAVETVGVCHLGDDVKYVYLSIPASQFAPTKSGHLKGHARHAATGRDRLGLTEEECLALN